MHDIWQQKPANNYMPVTFLLSRHIYNDFNSFILDPKTKTNQ